MTSMSRKMSTAANSVDSNDTIRMPAEWEQHQRTYMVWPKSEEIWSRDLLPGVKDDISKIANAIVKFEPVMMLVDPSQVSTAKSLLNENVEVVAMPVDDLWARDTLPSFVFKTSNGQQSLVGVDFNFNGWGNKQFHDNDSKIAERLVKMLEVESRKASIVSEGGSFETDGKGTLLATKSSLVNTNRNSQSIDEIEMELKTVLGVKKIIWFEGIKGQDITDFHVDGLVRFVRPGVVVLNRPFPRDPPSIWSKPCDEAASILKNATDADGNPFEVVELVEANPEKILYDDEQDVEMFLSSYVNYFIGNGFVAVPAFGDREGDTKARKTLQELFPERKVFSINIERLAAGGGGIHCATHDQPVA